jgi:ubiquinone/menaquinone biosynthesis C-methylase UbiE
MSGVRRFPLSAGRVARAAARRTPASLRTRLASPPTFDRTVFASFERDDGRRVDLWSGYRDAVKGRWRAAFPETRALLALAEHGPLPPSLLELRRALDEARSLPFPAEELAAALAEERERRPALFGGPLDVLPAEGRAAASAAAYRLSADRMLSRLRRNGLPRPAHVLEIGTATAYLAYALAAAGVGTVVGLDRDVTGYVTGSDREGVRAALRPPEGAVDLVAGDAHALPFEDASFDAVVSSSTLEHVEHPAQVLAETRRVLRPGGVAYHIVDPWFGSAGGHSLCTFDAPWLHARLTRAEVARYLRTHRPHEADAALAFYDTGFQRPRLALSELRAAVEGAGLQELRWRVTPGVPASHGRLLTGAIEADVRSGNPAASRRDLLAGGVAFSARRR